VKAAAKKTPKTVKAEEVPAVNAKADSILDLDDKRQSVNRLPFLLDLH
jgi:hypothetical protein